jgi:glycosyltransferase involved in cell wall biosynthesis
MEDRPIITKDDVLVFPEGAQGAMEQTRHLDNTRVVIALAWAYVFRKLPAAKTWQDYGIREALTPSRFIKEFLEWFMEIKVTLIHDYIDSAKFFVDLEAKKPKITYLSRKNKIGDLLGSVFARKSGLLSHYDWVPMEDFSEEEYARNLRESRIFVATSSEEGRNISVLEAMASGCIVVGFSGLGGSDYMVGTGEKRNCILVENGNHLDLGKSIERVALDLEQDSHCFDSVIQNARETARSFADFEKEGESLARFFRSLRE